MLSTSCTLPIEGNQKSLTLVDSDELRNLIDQVAVVSFDFFDTLFVRPLAHPEDAFDIIGRQFGIADFRSIRKSAQVDAFRRMQLAGRKEIQLQDIYACIADVGVERSQLMEAEFKLELALVEPNPEVVALYSDLIAAGKRIVITSDMYLPAEFFEQALQQHKLELVELFISADFNATKRDSGELFHALAKTLDVTASNILHIGDNLLADVTRAKESGLLAFHYQPVRKEFSHKTSSLEAMMAYGLLNTSAKHIPSGSYTELGFLYGGPANLGFLEWIRARARGDEVDHVFFLSRDGYSLDRLATRKAYTDFPAHCYLLGSRVTYTMASITNENFDQFLPFLLSGADGLAPSELLERIGVEAPAPDIMGDLGLGSNVKVNPHLYVRLRSFLRAYRWEILKVCQRNRRALYQYIRQLGVKPGDRVALVDVGWSGTTQETFEQALKPMMNLDVFGYYFCLADTPECKQRAAKQKMLAMIDSKSRSAQSVSTIYAKRVAVEQFFSAPHSSVIGLQIGVHGIEPVTDIGRGETGDLGSVSRDVCRGIEMFAEHYDALMARINVKSSPIQMVEPLIELLTTTSTLSGNAQELLGKIKNFDAWGSSRNHELVLSNYLG